MNLATVIYRQSSATQSQIRAHLEHCDSTYQPPLSQRVCIDDYATKIAQNAETFEAWGHQKLVGLVATYFNVAAGSGFVTSVSVEDGFTGHGIASTLMALCIERAQLLGVTLIALEVFRSNTQAINLYKKHGFVECASESGSIRMQLSLCGQPNQ